MPKRPGLTVVTRAGTKALYLRGTIRGHRIFESAGTDSPQLAEEARSTREAELYRAAVYGEKPSTPFAAAALSYLSTEARSAGTKNRVGRIVRHFGASLVCEALDQAAIDKACAALCRPGAAPATKLREVIAPTKAILSHAARRGWCAIPTFEAVKGGRKRTDWMTPAEAEAMIEGAHEKFRSLLTFLFCTGARVNEVIGLDWCDVDLQHGRAVFRGARDDAGLRGTKNGLDRIVDLPPRAIAALANLKERKGRVFRRVRGGDAYRDTNDSRTTAYGNQIAKSWRAALKCGGIIRHLTPHHARHTWATWQYAVHRDLLMLRDRGGWASVDQVERYAKLAPEGMAESILAFWGTPIAVGASGQAASRVAFGMVS
jgi:integrase